MRILKSLISLEKQCVNFASCFESCNNEADGRERIKSPLVVIRKTCSVWLSFNQQTITLFVSPLPPHCPSTVTLQFSNNAHQPHCPSNMQNTLKNHPNLSLSQVPPSPFPTNQIFLQTEKHVHPNIRNPNLQLPNATPKRPVPLPPILPQRRPLHKIQTHPSRPPDLRPRQKSPRGRALHQLREIGPGLHPLRAQVQQVLLVHG